MPDAIPKTAKMVFQGKIFQVWQWEQKMFDGSTEIFEKICRPATIEIIATVGDKIIIEEQSQPRHKNFISLVSGRQEKGESALATAKRELLEETGYKSNNWKLFLKHSGQGKVLHETFYFVAKDCKKAKEQSLDAGEKIKIKLAGFEEFLALTDEPKFWISPIFINYLLRARFDQGAKAELKALLFGGVG